MSNVQLYVQIVNVPIAVAYLFEGGDLVIVGDQVCRLKYSVQCT